MPPPPKSVLRAADANRSRVFDPWNSVGGGHQKPETKGPGGWRESRAIKMNSQLRGGNSGGARVHDTVGAGSLEFDESLGVAVPREVRARIGNSVVDMLRRHASGSSMAESETTTATSSSSSSRVVSPDKKEETLGGSNAITTVVDASTTAKEVTRASSGGDDVVNGGDNTATTSEKKKIFDNLVIYVNGSTYPIISDHKLKHLLAENGARMSIHLGRRQVTHVILGRPAAGSAGAGGGLAGGKLEKEIRRVGGVGVKYVGVEWVMESVKAGKRLSEARFANVKVASKGQQSVYGLFGGPKASSNNNNNNNNSNNSTSLSCQTSAGS